MSQRSFSADSTKFLSFILTIALSVPALSFGPRSETSNQPAAWTPELSMKVKGVGGVRVSPDGKWIAFTMADPPTADEEKNNTGKDDSRWIDENVKMNHLYVIPVAKDGAGKREPRQLTKGAFTVGSGLGGGGGFDWSPDGKSIVFTHTRTPKADDWTSANVSVVDVASGEIKAIAATAAAESQPIYSPDGKWIALTISDAPPTWAFQNRIHVLPAAGGPAGGGAPKPLALTFDEQPNLIGWAADGKRIFFNETRGTTTASPPAPASIRPRSSTRAGTPCCGPTRAARRDTARSSATRITRIGAAAITEI